MQCSRLVLIITLAVTVAGCMSDQATTGPSPAEGSHATLTLTPDSSHSSYLVVFRDDIVNPAEESEKLIAMHGGRRSYVYRHLLKGFAVDNLPDEAVAALQRNPRIEFIEPDQLLMPNMIQDVTQHSGFWGLDRVDETTRVLDGQYIYHQEGSGVHIYVVDSGINGNHPEFSGRIGNGAAFIKWSWNPSPYNDPIGHGTSVASIAAGSATGIAKKAILHSVRIDDGDPGAYASDIAAGLDWVAGNAIHPAVANLSYSVSSTTVRKAMERLVGYGVVLVKAAGNDGGDACTAEIGNNASGVLVVSAITNTDHRASFGNYGDCVDIFAPGAGVRVASGSTYSNKSGTSYAAPFATGLAALIRGDSRVWLSPWQVRQIIGSAATPNVLSNVNGSPNLLIHTDYRQLTIGGVTEVKTSDNPVSEIWHAKKLGGDDNWGYVWEERAYNGP